MIWITKITLILIHFTDRTIPNPVNIIDNIKKEGRSSVNFNPNAIETRDTVRALLIALEACGMMVKAEQSLANL